MVYNQPDVLIPALIVSITDRMYAPVCMLIDYCVNKVSQTMSLYIWPLVKLRRDPHRLHFLFKQ